MQFRVATVRQPTIFFKRFVGRLRKIHAATPIRASALLFLFLVVGPGMARRRGGFVLSSCSLNGASGILPGQLQKAVASGKGFFQSLLKKPEARVPLGTAGPFNPCRKFSAAPPNWP